MFAMFLKGHFAERFYGMIHVLTVGFELFSLLITEGPERSFSLSSSVFFP